MVRSVVVRLLVALGVLAGPAAVDGQPPGRVARVGILAGGGSGPAPGGFAPLRDRLAELGWVEGRNLHLEFRFAEAKLDRLPALAAELVRLNVDVLVASTPPGVRAAQQATPTLPIVMTAVVDPVGAGFVASLGRPGGNITGVSSAVPEGYFGKVLQLFKEARPGATRVGMLFNAGNPLLHRQRIHELAARHRLATFHPSLAGGMRQAAEYVDRILRGARPADLPVQPPSKYELIVNLRAARALGVTLPQTLLVSADEVLQ